MKVIAAAAGLVLATAVAFWDTRDFDFVNYDDQGYVTANPEVRGGLSVANARWAFTTGAMVNWHPLTWLSHMLDVELFGMEAGGHHLTSVVLHGLNTVLVFLLLNAATRAFWPSWTVAALFALHPLHVESVAWISERKDVLSTFFALLAFAAYGRYVRQPSAARYLAVGLALALGLMAKPMLVTLPFLLFLLDVWPLGRWRPAAGLSGLRPLVREKLPLFALVALSSAITFIVQQRGGAMRSLVGPSTRLGNAILSCTGYLERLVWPLDLTCFYPMQLPLPMGRVIASALGLLAVTALALRVGSRHPYVPVGWLWFVGGLVPVLGLLEVGPQVMADRYTYVPALGVFVIVAFGGAELARRWRLPSAALAGATAAMLVACFLLTRVQVSYWRDSRTLFSHALAVTTENYIAHTNLGAALAEAGESAEAIAHFEESLRIKPTFFHPRRALARELARTGRREEAVAQYREVARLIADDPQQLPALGATLLEDGEIAEAMPLFDQVVRLTPEDPKAHLNLGLALLKQGDAESALPRFAEALRLDARDAEAAYGLGNALAAVGRTDEAIVRYREAVALASERADVRNNLGVALADAGRDEEAAVQYREAIDHDPAYVDPRINLAAVLRRAGRLDDARAELETALHAAPEHPDAHYMLGNVLAQLGRLDDAAGHYVAALKARPAYAEAANNLGLVLAAQGRLAEAIGRYTEALAMEPGFAQAYYNRAVAYRQQGEPALASADHARARVLDPRTPEL